jgi:hypothetical protein
MPLLSVGAFLLYMNAKLKSVFAFFTHPLIVYLAIAVLSCLPHEQQTTIYHELPLVGDNFMSVSGATVYYYDGLGKYKYPTIECFQSFHYPAFGTAYEAGGIKCVDENINAEIPLLGNMCDQQSLKQPLVKSAYEKKYHLFFNKNYLLDNFSDVAHVACYALWALALMAYFRLQKHSYLLAFLSCLVGGILLEFIQETFIVGRTSSVSDVVLNQVGCAIGLGIGYLFIKFRDKKNG